MFNNNEDTNEISTEYLTSDSNGFSPYIPEQEVDDSDEQMAYELGY